nr:hypothetical protein GCM10020093_056720 [Planobispora longispora]
MRAFSRPSRPRQAGREDGRAEERLPGQESAQRDGLEEQRRRQGRQPSATRSMPVSAQRSTPVGIAPIGVSMTGIV